MNWCKSVCIVEREWGRKKGKRKTGGKGQGEAVIYPQTKENGDQVTSFSWFIRHFFHPQSHEDQPVPPIFQTYLHCYYLFVSTGANWKRHKFLCNQDTDLPLEFTQNNTHSAFQPTINSLGYVLNHIK